MRIAIGLVLGFSFSIAQAQEFQQRAAVPAVALQQARPTLPSAPPQSSPNPSNATSVAGAPAGVKAEQMYVIQFTEFRMKKGGDPNLSEQEILQSYEALVKEGRLELLESIRMSVLEYYEGMVQFGKNKNLPVGVVNTNQGRSVNTVSTAIGTLLRVTATPQDEKILVKISFEASRFPLEFDSEDPDNTTSPDILKVVYGSTLLMEVGKPSLIFGTGSDNTDFMVVTIRKKG